MTLLANRIVAAAGITLDSAALAFGVAATAPPPAPRPSRRSASTIPPRTASERRAEREPDPAHEAKRPLRSRTVSRREPAGCARNAVDTIGQAAVVHDRADTA